MKPRIWNDGLKGVLSTLAVLALLSGCGGRSQSPLSPDPVAVLQTDAGGSRNDSPAYFVLSSRDMDASQALRATKPSGKATLKKTVEKVSARRGGALGLLFDYPRGADKDDVFVRTATFLALPGSMDTDNEITMAVSSGLTLEDIVVTFGPSGLTFSPPAILTLSVRGNLDTKALKAYHVSGAGSGTPDVETVPISFLKVGNEWIIIIKVPGFSMYSIGDEYMPPEAGP